MAGKTILWIGLAVIASLAVIVVVTLALTPAQTNPAFDAAITFINVAGKGDDATAFSLLSSDMQWYVQANCPNGSISACVQGYIPPEWGGLLSAVFRRAAPDGDAWDVDLIATYEQGKGFSGVCIYHRLEQDETGSWRVAGWAGFISCGDAESRAMADNPDTPNRAP